jgi:hypothetical protein
LAAYINQFNTAITLEGYNANVNILDNALQVMKMFSFSDRTA